MCARILDVILRKLLFIKPIVDKVSPGFVWLPLGLPVTSSPSPALTRSCPLRPTPAGWWLVGASRDAAGDLDLTFDLRPRPPGAPSRWSAHCKTLAKSLEIPQAPYMPCLCLCNADVCSAINDELCFGRGWVFFRVLTDITVDHTPAHACMHTHTDSQMIIPLCREFG